MRARILLTLALAACSAQRAKDPLAGNVKMKLGAQGRTPDFTAGPPALCATFTLTPYALGASGTQSQAGSAVTFTSTAGGITPILGCVHTPGVSPDWRYLVTAGNFAGCNSTVAGLTPSVETFTVDVDCTPGQDVPAQVTATVSIPVANDAGYLDIGVGVNVSTPPSGCKNADIDASGAIHFGQSYVQSSGGPTPSAYTGIGLYAPAASSGAATPSGTLQQFAGSVSAGAQTDAFFTGLLQMPPAPQSATIVQAFAQPCPGQMTVQPHAVECVTQAALPATAATQVQIADVFAEWPGRGAVSATITSAQAITLYTSLGGPHLGSINPTVLGHDDLTHTQALSLAPAAVIGLYGSLVHAEELLALVQDPSLGTAVQVLTLDEATGQWSAAAAVALSSFSLAQQQAIGLFGAGGCFPEPLPLCGPAPQAALRPSRDLRTSQAQGGPTGIATLTATPGTVLATTAAEGQIALHLQWSVSNLAPGQYVYPALTLCSPFGGIHDTNGGGFKPGATCNNGYEGAQDSIYAFAPVQVDGTGGVTQDLQLSVSAAGFFTDVSSWTIPVSLFTSTTGTANPATDTPVPLAGGTPSATVNLTELHDRWLTIQVASVKPVAGGLVFRLYYSPLTLIYNDVGLEPHYLEGTSDVELGAPTVTNGLTATLVPNSLAQISDGFNASWSAAETARHTNTNITPSVVPDAVNGGIPHVSIDNLLTTCCSGGNQEPVFSADWFVPTPTQQGTFFSVHGSITWNGTTDTHSGFDVHGANGLDISPVPVAQLVPEIFHGCGDSFETNFTTARTSLSAQYNAGLYNPDGTPGSGVAPQLPASGDGGCEWVFNWQSIYYFAALRNPGNAVAATLINPDYVIRLPDEERISSSKVNENGSLLAPTWSISTSDNAACDNTTLGDGSWADIATTPARADWSSVRCLRYQYNGTSQSPGFYEPFRTRLDASITSGAAVNALRFTTMRFWATADNVLPDAANNSWALGWLVSTWHDTSFLETSLSSGAVQPVDTFISAWVYEAHVAGLSVPDLVIDFEIAPGAVYESSDPVTWFTSLSGDDNGASTVPACAIAPADPRHMTCTLTSKTAGTLIPGQGGTFTNSTNFFPRFKFLPSESYNGELKPRTVTLSSTASWLPGSGSVTRSDTVIGPNELLISKAVHGGATTANAGANVAFDLSYGAGGLNSGQLGAGGVAIYDFFGRDYQPGSNGAAGTLVPQAADCASPVPVSVSALGATGGSATPGAPIFYQTTSNAPDLTPATQWTPVPAGGTLDAHATALKIVPVSSKGQSGVLLPVDGTGAVQVVLASKAGAQGRLCNSAALAAALFQPTVTQDAAVTLNPPCDPNPTAAR
jgi:hypothetical protein